MSIVGNVIVAVIFLLLFLLERFFPLRRLNRPLIERLISNVGITTLAFAVNATAVQFAAHATQQWTSAQVIGLIHLIPLPAAAQFIIAFLLMEKL